jgi:hypothetical protein
VGGGREQLPRNDAVESAGGLVDDFAHFSRGVGLA